MKTSSGGYTQGKQGELPTIKMAETTEREQELSALHRSYRMMETDRQKYNEESQVRRCPATLPLAASDGADAVVECTASITAMIIFTCFCFPSVPALSLSSCCCRWLTASPPPLTLCNRTPASHFHFLTFAEHYQAAEAGDRKNPKGERAT